MSPEEFIARWSESGASERSNYQLILSKLCDFLAVGHPDPARADTRSNDYVFERRVDYRANAGDYREGVVSCGRCTSPPLHRSLMLVSVSESLFNMRNLRRHYR